MTLVLSSSTDPAASMCCLVASLILVSLCAAKLLPEEKGCEEPEMPLGSTYLCQPALCQGPLETGVFKAGALLEYYCRPGYILASLPGVAVCRRGEWHLVQEVLCKPHGTSVALPGHALALLSSLPLLAGALVLLSALASCLALCFLVLRSTPSPCISASQAYETLEEPDMLVVEGVDGPGATHVDIPLSLPSYEEAVCGHSGASVPPARQGPMPLTFSAQPEGSDVSHGPGGSLDVEDSPPSYQEAVAAASTTAEDAAERARLAARWPPTPSFPLGR